MDGNGNYYRINDNNQLVAAKDRDEADFFDLRTANDRIGTGKKAKFYYTIPVDDLEQTENEMLSGFDEEEDTSDNVTKESVTVVSIRPEKKEVEIPMVSYNDNKSINEYDIENIDWLAYMQHFTFLAKASTDYIEKLSARISDVDKEMCDLLHYIELYDLSEEEMIDVTERIKDSRLRRREIKDEYTKVEWFKKEFATNANVIKANSVIGQMRKLNNRVYRPRQIDEIFDGMKGRETNRSEYLRKQEDTVEEVKKHEEVAPMEYIRKETALDGREHDWLAFAKQQSEFYDNAKQYMINLHLDMDEIDAQIEDTMIMIEDAKFNVTQGYKVFKQLKELRNLKKEKQKEYDCISALTNGLSIGEVSDKAYYAVKDIEEILEVTENGVFEEVSEDEAEELVDIVEEAV